MFPGTTFGTATSTPFGQSTFGKPATTGFSAPVFGSTPGTSLFGSTTQPSGGLFGSTNPAPAFGQPQTTQPTFGSGFSGGTTGTSLFGSGGGATSGTGTSLFGTGTGAGGGGFAKPTGFGPFGSTTSTAATPLFGTAQPQQTTSLFGQPATQSPSGLFGSTFGTAQGGTTIKFTPVTGSDSMIKNGVSTNISTRHHCITCMKEYESKSLEELRLEDYMANRKGPQGAQTGGGLFSNTGQTSLFSGTTGNTSAFGTGTTSVFGTGSANTGTSLFGKPAATAAPAFGSTPATTAATFGGFNTTSSLFGANTNQAKPFGSTTGTGLFGTTSQPSTSFGTQSTGFGFGAPQQNTGIFSQNKPAFSLGGSSTGGTTGFFSSPAASTTSMFGAKPAGTTGFGTFPSSTPNTGVFAATSNTQTGTSLFGNNFKGPTGTSGFNFGQPATTNTLGSGLSLGGSSNLFGNTANKPGGLFGSTGTTGLFGTNTFGSTTPSLFGNTLGTNTNFSIGSGNANLMSSNIISNPQPQMNNTINQHMLALASMPFGDSPLFKNLLPATGKADELIKPTSPAAQKALISGQNFKISPKSASKIKVKPIGVNDMTKKSLFDGLDSDIDLIGSPASVIRPNPKRLVLRPRVFDSSLNRSVGLHSPNPTLISPVTPLLPNNRSNSELEVDNQITPKSSALLNSPGIRDSSKSTRDLLSVPHNNTIGEVRQEEVASISLKKGITGTGSLSPNNSTSRASTSNTPTCSPSPKQLILNNQKPENKEEIDWDKEHSRLEDVSNKDITVTLSEQQTSSSSSDSECGETSEHITGIVLRRIGYYTIPPLEELASLIDSDGQCIVDNFTIGRLNYGNIFYPESFDVSNLNIDEIVHFRHKEVVVYPDDGKKPSVGEGLNRRAQVTLDRVWPIDKSTRLPVSDPSRIAALDYESKLRAACAKHGSKFVEYRPQTGSWVFKVDHFSKYGLTDSDEEDGAVGITAIGQTNMTGGAVDVNKLKLLSIDQLKAASGIPSRTPYQNKALSSMDIHHGTNLLLGEEDEEMEDGITTPFDLDDEIERGSALSPTSKLSLQLGTSSHKVQLMKASFFDHDEYNIHGDYFEYDPHAHQINGDYLNEFGRRVAPSYSQKLSSLGGGAYKSSRCLDLRSFSPESEVGEMMRERIMKEVEEEEEVMVLSEESPLFSVEAKSLQPTLYTLKHLQEVVPWSKSTAGKFEARVLLDKCIMKGRSFKVSWGSKSQLVHLSTCENKVFSSSTGPLELTELGNLLIGREEDDVSPNVLQITRIRGGEPLDHELTFEESIVGHLEVALDESESQIEDGIPGLSWKKGSGILELEGHVGISEGLINRWSKDNSLSISHQIWSLCLALWGNLPESDNQDKHEYVMARKKAVSDWLVSVVAESVESDLNLYHESNQAAVFILLTGYRIYEACMKAQEIGDLQLSMLLSQSDARGLLGRQLEEWRESGFDKWIDRDWMRSLMLAAGIPIHRASYSVVNACKGLDWLRAYGIHLWYVCPMSSSVTDTLLAYETSFQGLEKEKKREGGYAAPPSPPYVEEGILESSKGKQTYHIAYHLLKLHSVRSHPLEPLLNPTTYTMDMLDYRLSWFLMRVLGSLGYNHVSRYTASLIHTSFASQLESHGLWEWAAFVLLHLEDSYGREGTIKELLRKHLSLEPSSPKEHFLREKLKIPNTWIYEAKATRAISEKKYHEAAGYLIKAKNWNHAHCVIMEHISSKAIVNEKYDYLEGLLEEINEIEERRHVVGGWTAGGKVILAYLAVMKKLKELEKGSAPPASQLIASLQPSLAQLCANIKLLPTKTPIDRLCQVEMAKRCSNLVQSVVSVVEGTKEGIFETLTHLVAQLPLPSDYAPQEWVALVSSWRNAIPS